jgi:hypothetical protein
MRLKPTTPAATLIAGLLAAAVLTGCGNGISDSSDSGAAADSTPSATTSESVSPSATPTESAAPKEAGPSLTVDIAGDKVTPNGQAIQVAPGKPLTITFNTDRAGELHVHSKPEQFVEFSAGTSTKKLTIEVPGVVEVEEHDTSHVVAQIEVK